MLSTRTVDLWSAILQLIVLVFLSELATSPHETLMLGSGAGDVDNQTTAVATPF